MMVDGLTQLTNTDVINQLNAMELGVLCKLMWDRDLRNGGKKPEYIRTITQLSPKKLSQCLHVLEDKGLIKRTQLKTSTLKYEQGLITITGDCKNE